MDPHSQDVLDSQGDDETDLLCPCCAERVTVSVTATEHECPRCGQLWAMKIDLDRLVRFSVL